MFYILYIVKAVKSKTIPCCETSHTVLGVKRNSVTTFLKPTLFFMIQTNVGPICNSFFSNMVLISHSHVQKISTVSVVQYAMNASRDCYII